MKPPRVPDLLVTPSRPRQAWQRRWPRSLTTANTRPTRAEIALGNACVA